jgi:hypothetical protein
MALDGRSTSIQPWAWRGKVKRTERTEHADRTERTVRPDED